MQPKFVRDPMNVGMNVGRDVGWSRGFAAKLVA